MTHDAENIFILNKSIEVKDDKIKSLEAQVQVMRIALEEIANRVNNEGDDSQACVSDVGYLSRKALSQTAIQESKRKQEAMEAVVSAAKRVLERIDFNGGLGEYKGGPTFVTKDLREAIKALDDFKGGK